MHVRYCSSSLLITSSDNKFEVMKNSTTLLPQNLCLLPHKERVDLRKELKYVKNAVEFKDSNTEQSTSYKISYKVIHFDYESNRKKIKRLLFTIISSKCSVLFLGLMLIFFLCFS